MKMTNTDIQEFYERIKRGLKSNNSEAVKIALRFALNTTPKTRYYLIRGIKSSANLMNPSNNFFHDISDHPLYRESCIKMLNDFHKEYNNGLADKAETYPGFSDLKRYIRICSETFMDY